VPTWWLHWCVLKDYLTNPVSIWNLIDVIKGVSLSFELITVNIIINAVNHKYNDRLSWSNLEIRNSVFNFFILNHKYVFPCTQKCMRDKGFPVTWTFSVHSMTYTKPKPVTHTHTHTHTHTCYNCMVEESLEILFAMAIGPTVAFCWIPQNGKKQWIESVLESW